MKREESEQREFRFLELWSKLKFCAKDFIYREVLKPKRRESEGADQSTREFDPQLFL
jgi:hypothetical protein